MYFRVGDIIIINNVIQLFTNITISSILKAGKSMCLVKYRDPE